MDEKLEQAIGALLAAKVAVGDMLAYLANREIPAQMRLEMVGAMLRGLEMVLAEVVA